MPGYHVGADGVTALFVLLAALIAVLMTLYGLVRGLAAPGRLMALILLAEAALMAMLVTVNLLWFALFSVVELAVAGYLIGHWSTSTEENRSLAMTRFLQFQGVGVAPAGRRHARAGLGPCRRHRPLELRPVRPDPGAGAGQVPVGRLLPAVLRPGRAHAAVPAARLAAARRASRHGRHRALAAARRQGRHLRHGALPAAADGGGGAWSGRTSSSPSP